MTIDLCPACNSTDLMFSKKKQVWICEDCDHTFTEENPFAALRIFLSYGRDEYAAIAERIKDDLTSRGHKVWFDKERLREGRDWEAYIEEGLDFAGSDPATGRVVFLMTPHSVRRPDGYCLNEIAKALSHSLPIVPVMLVYSEPPLSIYRLQYLDMQDCLPLSEKEVLYGQRFERLLLALEENRLDFEGTQGKLLKALAPISFSADIVKLLKDFTGRRWVFTAVDAWLADPQGSKLFWLTGAPGVGKSAISAWLRDHYREVAAFHFCDVYSEEKRDPCKLVRSLAYQLSTQLPDYEEHLARLNLDEIVQESREAYTLFDKLIIQPLADNYPEPDRTLVLLIDALDEATREQHNEIALLLSRCADKTPPWLRLFVTSRPEPEIATSFQALDPFTLDTSTAENLADLRNYLQQRHPGIEEHATNLILERSEGVFLYLRHVSEEINAGRLSLKRPEDFPRGLGEIYHQFFERQFGNDKTHYKNTIRPLICAILAAYEPLDLETLLQLFAYPDRMRLYDDLDQLGSLFPRNNTDTGGTVSPFHKSLSDWLGDKSCAGLWYADIAHGHKLIADKGWQVYKQHPDQLTPYQLAWLPTHLAQCDQAENVRELLFDFDLMMQRCKASKTENLLNDWRETIHLFPQQTDRNWQIMESFFRSNAHILRRGNADWPTYKILLQLAIEHAEDSPLTIEAEKYLAEGKCDWAWLRRQQRPEKANLDPCIAVFEGHGGEVNGALELEGESFLTWAEDGTLRIWRKDGKCLAVLNGHTDSVSEVQILKDGKIVSRSRDLTVCLWTSDGRKIGNTSHYDEIDKLVWERHLVNLSENLAGNPEGLESLVRYKMDVGGIVPVEDGGYFTWGRNQKLKKWSRDGDLISVFLGDAQSMLCGCLRVCGNFVVVWNTENVVYVLNDCGEVLHCLKWHTEEIRWVVEIEENRILSCSDDGIVVFDLKLGDIVKVYLNLSGIYGFFKFYDGRILCSKPEMSISIDLNCDVNCNNDKYGLMFNSKGELSFEFSKESFYVGDIVELPNKYFSIEKSGCNHIYDGEGKLKLIYEGSLENIEKSLILDDNCLLSRSGNMFRIEVAGKEVFCPVVRKDDLLFRDGRREEAEYRSDWILTGEAGHCLKLWTSVPSGKNASAEKWVSLKSVINGDKRARWRKQFLKYECSPNCFWTENGLIGEVSKGQLKVRKLKGLSSKISFLQSLPNGGYWACTDDTLSLWDANGDLVKDLVGGASPAAKVIGHPYSQGRFFSWLKGDTEIALWDESGEPLAHYAEEINSFPVDSCEEDFDFGIVAQAENGPIFEDGLESADWVFEVERKFDNDKEASDVEDFHFEFPDELDDEISEEQEEPFALEDFELSSSGPFYRDLEVEGILPVSRERLLVWTRGGVGRLWRTQDGVLLKKLELRGDVINGFSELSDGRFVSWSKESIHLWSSFGDFLKSIDCGRGKGIPGLTPNPDQPESVVLLSNGKFVSWSLSGRIRVWAEDFCDYILIDCSDGMIFNCSDGLIKYVVAVDFGQFIVFRKDDVFLCFGSDGDLIFERNKSDIFCLENELWSYLLPSSQQSNGIGVDCFRSSVVVGWKGLQLFWHGAERLTPETLDSAYGCAIAMQEDGQICVLSTMHGAKRVALP